MRPAAVILDFDGVVVDSLAAHLGAWGEAVAEIFHRPLPSPAELAGHATRTIAHILSQRFGDPSLATALAKAKERCLARRFGNIPLLPGAREFIAELDRRQIPYGIASNSPRDFVVGALAGNALAVDVVVTGSDVSRGKPAPDIFWDCANRLAVAVAARAAVAVYEDSAHGLKAAQRAGMVPLGVASELAAAKLMDAGARAVCAHLADALQRGWLDELP